MRSSIRKRLPAHVTQRASLFRSTPKKKTTRRTNNEALRQQQVPEFGDLCRDRANAFCGLLNERLGEAQFIGGDHYSMADISAQMSLDFGKVVKVCTAENHTNLQRWHKEVSTRPSAAA